MSALLELDKISKSFSRGGLLSTQRIDAVKEVSFALQDDKPEIFTVIGESGSGKSTLAGMILGIHAPSSGRIRLAGRDVAAYERRAFMAEVQPIFQNPFEAFNPLKQLDRYLFMTAERFGGAVGKSAAGEQADEALRQVGLSLAEIAGRFPHELSGGQLQRVAIARALVAKPRLIVADEPVSMVDASLRMSIVNLFGRLRDDLGLSIVYITHDLATAYYISDRLIIMQKGVVVEEGAARAVLSAPTHPYSRQLRDAVLTPDSAGAFRTDHPRKAVATPGATS
ncbi:ABC transporter ATP-binding protein [Bosea sp. LjRoot237]|uniref:ABC transporter ATP-binding protein n=1 Tax=Bosea sp. LjRoot237 TaxID=3342292 RepID=UPI003ECE3D0B